jgi:hypothetical protein
MRGIAFLPLVALGCVSTSVAHLSPARYESRSAETPIRVYSSQQPTCAFTEIAIVTAQTETWLVSDDAALDALRSKARALGGDAVVGVGFDKSHTISGTVIRFDHEDCTH